MSPSAVLPFVEKFPNVSREERAFLLEWARTTTLNYGAWKPFKKLFKKTEDALEQNPDIELMSVLLRRIDEMSWAQSSTRWKAVETTSVGQNPKSVSGNGFTYTVGSRNNWYDYSGWRLVITSDDKKGVVSSLRKALGLTSQDESAPQTIAFDFDARTYIYEVKNVKLEGGELQIVCSPSWRGAQNPETVFVVDVSDPNFIHLRESGPKTPTIQYMKRRARRILRELSKKNPELYIQLAMQLLRLESNRVLDAATNWATFDVLFAQSPRWKQTQPGRGAYKNTGGFVRLRREERAPEIWDAHLSQVQQLLLDKTAPIEANEMALKILRANKTEHRVLDAAQLQRFLDSNSALLQSFATRALTEAILDGQQIDGVTWANLVLKSNARNRRLLIEKTGDATFYVKATRVFSEALDGSLATKKRRAAAVLVARFADEIGDETLWKHLETFADVNAETRRWVFGKIAESAARGEFARLSSLATLREDLRDQAIRVFSEASKNAQPTIEQSLPLVATADQENNAIGWQFLAATAMTSEVARELWRRVLETTSSFAAQVHATAAQSAGALQLFERVGFSPQEIEFWLPKLSAFVAALSPAFFAFVFQRLSSVRQIELALGANDEQWKAARATLLQTLQNAENLGAFWNRVLDVVANGDDDSDVSSANEVLQKRLLDDEEIAATFVRVPSETVAELLTHTPMELEPYLVRWLQANLSELGRSDGALLAAATHPFGAIRALGLARIQQTGMDLPLALRLMESGLPQPFEMAKVWFETHEKLDLADRALALCDSPDAAVRAFGREFLENNRDRVLDEKLLRKLSENADPQMQAWLAEHLLKDAASVQVSAFDQSVLRARGRARRAKEAVKMRRDLSKNVAATSQTPNIEYSNDDVSTLLEVARGRTLRDRDWALQQLAQIALSGQKIDGVHLS